LGGAVVIMLLPLTAPAVGLASVVAAIAAVRVLMIVATIVSPGAHAPGRPDRELEIATPPACG
jgi:hypothetical protein